MGLIPTIEETKQVIAEALHFAAVCAAQKSKIDEPELLSLQELHSALEKASPTLFESLQTLCNKYGQWLGVYESAATKKSLSQAQAHTELEAARSVFLKALHAA